MNTVAANVSVLGTGIVPSTGFDCEGPFSDEAAIVESKATDVLDGSFDWGGHEVDVGTRKATSSTRFFAHVMRVSLCSRRRLSIRARNSGVGGTSSSMASWMIGSERRSVNVGKYAKSKGC